MALDKQGNFSQQPSELPDVPSPSMTPDQIRAKWQTPLDELKTTMNNAFDKLNGTGNGTSGAYNVGATDWDGVTASTVGALLSWLKANKTDLTGNHQGTWQGFNPSQVDQTIRDQVNTNTSQLADIAYSLKNPPPPLLPVKADGSDETTNIQAIFNTGMKISIPEGTYGINSSLLFKVSNSGQIIEGVNAEKVIFKPTANVATVFKLDGTPDNGYMTNFDFSNFTIDMANMSDLSTSIAIEQIKAWGGKFKNVRVINDGTNKRAFSFKAGAYTTILENCKGNVLEMIGDSLSDAVTTMTFIGCDFEQMYARYAVSTTILQPIVQNSRDKFDIDYVDGFVITGGDIEGTGTYLKLGANVNFLYSAFNSFVGFSGTYMTGTPLDRSYLHDQYQTEVQLYKQDYKIFDGIINAIKSTGGLFRHIFQGNGASQVDLQFTNISGSNFFGISATGDAIVDCRATGAFDVQSSGTSKFHVGNDGKLTLNTVIATTATAGANGAVPAQVAGYITVNIGGTDFKIPYFGI